jgi:hypothetical protein
MNGRPQGGLFIFRLVATGSPRGKFSLSGKATYGG